MIGEIGLEFGTKSKTVYLHLYRYTNFFSNTVLDEIRIAFMLKTNLIYLAVSIELWLVPDKQTNTGQ